MRYISYIFLQMQISLRVTIKWTIPVEPKCHVPKYSYIENQIEYFNIHDGLNYYGLTTSRNIVQNTSRGDARKFFTKKKTPQSLAR